MAKVVVYPCTLIRAPNDGIFIYAGDKYDCDCTRASFRRHAVSLFVYHFALSASLGRPLVLRLPAWAHR